jgi:hypothetical protein
MRRVLGRGRWFCVRGERRGAMRDVRAERWARSEASMRPMQWWLLREDRSDGVFFKSLRGAPTSRGGMTTTIWRPKVRIDVPDVGEIDDKDTRRDESTKKGTKRKYAPKHFGPCKHGVKWRSQCKVCSACPHGRQRSQCKECGGASICEHGRQRSQCKECGGGGICEHGRQRYDCKECHTAKQ